MHLSEAQYYNDGQASIYLGNALEILAELPPESIDAVVTSPPYWGLRLYQGEQTVVWGAWRGQYGNEPTIELYLAHSVEILREIRRVLKKTGTVWWNISDSMAGSNSGKGDYRKDKSLQRDIYDWEHPQAKAPGLKPLDLCLIPQRLAIRLQEDGWWVRSIIIWEKPSAMPESVNGWRWEQHKVKVGNRGRGKERWRQETGQQDHDVEGNFLNDAIWQDCPGCPKCSPNDGLVLRKGSWQPTGSFEYILMLTKSASYYGDREAIAEPLALSSIERGQYRWHGQTGDPKEVGARGGTSFVKMKAGDIALKELFLRNNKRNLRSVWRMNTANFKGDHFAVYPEELPRKCILASTSEKGNCPKCGAPWARVVKHKPSKFNVRVSDASAGKATAEEGYKASQEEIENYIGGDRVGDDYYTKTLGWRPTCKCGPAQTSPPVILDPFCGTGTTLWAAKKLGRHSIGIDISEKYCRISADRVRQRGLEGEAH